MAENKKDLSLRIVFFDGVCHLCNGFVHFVIQNETAKASLIFAPLQGATAELYLSPEDRENLSSVIFWNQGETLKESDAILEILKYLRHPWSGIGAIGSYCPKAFRNCIYHFLAKRRYQWFGKRESCRLPEPHERQKLWP